MSENENQVTPFGQTRSLMAVDPAAVAAGEAVKARIQAAYIMSYQKPRNIDQARAKILKMCEIPEFAEKVEYSKPIGGKKVKGLSIRAAEAFLALYENILSEAQLLFEDDNIKRIRISALDLEGNTQFSRDISIKKTVERLSKNNREDDVISERQNSRGKTTYLLRATEDEVLVKESAYVSKFIRTEGLRLIPADIKEEAIKKARAVLATRDREDPNAAKKRILDAFSGLNIWPKDLEKYIGHSADTISPSEIADLRTVYSAIETGEASWSDYVSQKFEPPKAKTQTQDNETTTPQNESKPETEPEDETPKTNPKFAELVKKECDKDFDYVPSIEGLAHDNLSAFIELSSKHNDISPYEMMDNISTEGTFPGFWNGFINGTWKKHFEGTLPQNVKPEDKSQPTEPKKEPEKTGEAGSDNDKPENINPFDRVDWSASGLKAKGTQGYWDQYKDKWETASEKGKEAFKEKWLRVFTKDGNLTVTFPWIKKEESKPDPEPDPPTREPGDDTELENEHHVDYGKNERDDSGLDEGEERIDYRANLIKIQVEDKDLLIKACDAVGYGKNLVIPMAEKAQKTLYEKCMELKD